MKKLLCCCLALGLVSTAFGSDLLVANKGKPAGISQPAQENENDCGALAFDGVNGLAGQRRDDGLESFVLAPCAIDGTGKMLAWYAIDNSEFDWNGNADYSAWDANDVENGCANNGNTVASESDVPNDREPLLDNNGNQVVLFGRLAWIYTVPVSQDLSGAGYVAPRVRVTAGQSFILTRPCDGDGPIWFQSEFFGFPCAVPGRNVFGQDFCGAIELRSDFGPPTGACCQGDGTCTETLEEDCDGASWNEGEDCDTFECPIIIDQCLYAVTKVELKKQKSVLCLKVCDDCPFEVGDIVCGLECDEADDCKDELKGKILCAGGGMCKVEAKQLEREAGCGSCPADALNACPDF